jgi:hypothetical protein
MAYKPYIIRPLEHGLDTSYPGLHLPAEYAQWPAVNFRVIQGSLRRRLGYVLDRNLTEDNGMVHHIVLYTDNVTGSRYTIFLTDYEAIRRERASGKTWSYITDSYTTGSITSITGTPKVNVLGSGTTFTACAAGDYFVMTADLTADEEPQTVWRKIKTVTDATHIILEDSYGGATGSGNYIIRRPYTVPSNERWTWCVVKNNFIFTNGNVNVQAWSGSGYAADINATYASKARYCAGFANRLFLADLDVSGSRSMYTVRWSAENDPTIFDSGANPTAGEADLLQSSDFITGLKTVGTNLVVFRTDSLVLGTQTGVSTKPVSLAMTIPGIGCVAPHSVVEAEGTAFWVGRNDVWKLEAGNPVPIGKAIKDKLYDQFFITPSEITKTYGFADTLRNEIMWFVRDLTGVQWILVFNYKYGSWYAHRWTTDMAAGGKGEI